MVTISPVTTWVSLQTLTAAALNGEFTNVYNYLNNADSGSTTWTQVKATLATLTTASIGALTSTTTTVLIGTTTNDSAAAGNIGERITSTSSLTNFPSTGNYGDLTSITLSGGDWDVGISMQSQANGATVTAVTMGASTTTGNSSTGLVNGDTAFTDVTPPTSTSNTGLCISKIRFSLTGSTIVYLKFRASFSVATPQAVGRITARRVR